MKSAKDVANDIQKWIDGGSRPDEWKMGEWVRVLESFSPEAARIPIDTNMILNAKEAEKVGMERITISVPIRDILYGPARLPQSRSSSEGT